MFLIIYNQGKVMSRSVRPRSHNKTLSYEPLHHTILDIFKHVFRPVHMIRYCHTKHHQTCVGHCSRTNVLLCWPLHHTILLCWQPWASSKTYARILFVLFHSVKIGRCFMMFEIGYPGYLFENIHSGSPSYRSTSASRCNSPNLH